jgi:hypothetical protein
MKIRPLGAELFLVDGRTLGMTKLIVAFRIFVIALKMLDICSEDGLQSQKCERNSVVPYPVTPSNGLRLYKKKIVPFSSNGYFCSPEHSSFSK